VFDLLSFVFNSCCSPSLFTTFHKVTNVLLALQRGTMIQNSVERVVKTIGKRMPEINFSDHPMIQAVTDVLEEETKLIIWSTKCNIGCSSPNQIRISRLAQKTSTILFYVARISPSLSSSRNNCYAIQSVEKENYQR